MDAIPDIQVINEIERPLRSGGVRLIPYLAADDGILGAFQIRPGVVITGGLDSNGDPRAFAPYPGRTFLTAMSGSVARRSTTIPRFPVQILAEGPFEHDGDRGAAARRRGALLAPASGAAAVNSSGR